MSLTYIKFDETHFGQKITEFSVETKEAIENYLIHGYSPGGFMTAILTGDLYRAVGSADISNQKYLWNVAKWIALYAPPMSFGDRERVKNWIDDKDGVRSKFADPIKKAKTWEILSSND